MKMTKEQLKEIDRIIEEGYERGNEIVSYWHCGKCLDEDNPQRIGVGWTPKGIQVWCEIHNENVWHIDLLGQKVGIVKAKEVA
jgi:hypothetical protein